MKSLIHIASLILLSSVAVHSQTVEDYVQMARDNNPGLKAYFHAYQAAGQQAAQVGALPDPEFSAGFALQPMERYMGNEVANFQLMQMFPWFGTVGAKKKQAEYLADTQYHIHRKERNNLDLQVKFGLLDLYAVDREIALTKENLELLKQWERLALAQFGSAGQNAENTSMRDVLRARMDIREGENNLAERMKNRLELREGINALLNRSPEMEVNAPDTLHPVISTGTMPEILGQNTDNHPQLAILESEKNTYVAEGNTARREGRPTFGIGVEYMWMQPRTENGMDMGGHDMVMPMVSLSIPIYRSRHNARSKEAEIMARAIEERQEEARNLLAQEWNTAHRNLLDADRRAKMYRELLILARQTEDMLLTSYSADGSDFEEVLEMRSRLLEYESNLIRAIVDQHKSVATLENLAARPLD